MQGGHGGYGHAGYGYGGYDAGASSGGYGGYDAGASAGGYGGYDSAAGYGYDSAAGYGYYSGGGYPSAYEDPVAAGRRAHGLPAPPLDGLELQPSEACPRNYVIFDQTSTDSRVTFHPSLAHRLGGSTSGHDDGGSSCCYAGAGKEDDAEEIDALLSSEDDAASSPDSACSSSRGGKKGRAKKMMRTLKGIVPGADHMDTPAVLDEAVRYLKSLKLDATNKLGARGSDR